VIELTRRYDFPAAHVLRHPAFSEEENRRVYGKCAHPAGHGHDYGLEVTLGEDLLAPEELDAIVEERILARLSHRLLNELEPFLARVPTAENIARVAYESLADPIARAGARLVRICVVETPRNRFEYSEDESDG
jgi:6-pyruvoyltetrahydropterin/6-carboxytetrahydropterin synthase